MLETIELRSPVLIDGEQVRELSYDIDLVSADQFVEAEVLAASASTRLGKMAAKVVELDAGFQFYLGAFAIIAANPTYDVPDIERIKGPDLMKVMRIGRNFTTADAEEGEGEDFASTDDLEEDEETENFPLMQE